MASGAVGVWWMGHLVMVGFGFEDGRRDRLVERETNLRTAEEEEEQRRLRLLGGLDRDKDWRWLARSAYCGTGIYAVRALRFP